MYARTTNIGVFFIEREKETEKGVVRGVRIWGGGVMYFPQLPGTGEGHIRRERKRNNVKAIHDLFQSISSPHTFIAHLTRQRA